MFLYHTQKASVIVLYLIVFSLIPWLSVLALAGAIVLLSLAFLMPAFYYIPKASLAAVIICAVAPMVDFHIVAKMWKIRSKCLLLFLICTVCLRFQDSFSCDVGANVCFTGLDLLPFTVTFLMSFWQVQYGIIAGVATSGVLLLYNVARPQIKVSEVFVYFYCVQ